MADISIGILGFDRIGASVAMALRRYNAKGGSHHFKITGFDSRAGIEREVAAAKITDEMVNRVFNAVRNKDIVVIAMPYAEVKAVYETIGADLRPGVVILDMSSLALPSLSWGKKYLPEGAHLVGVKPMLNPTYLFDAVDDLKHAHEDLFDKGNMLLMPSSTAIKDAVELAVDFATLLGSRPHFFDPAEHDGLIAATEGMPAILGVLSFYALSKSQGWGDSQRMINPTFGAPTHYLYDTHPDDLRDLLLNNRENTLRYLDDFIITLHHFRDVLSANDQDAVEALLVESSDTYEKWINRRHNGQWDDSEKAPDVNAAGGMMRGMMGEFLSNRITGKKNKDE